MSSDFDPSAIESSRLCIKNLPKHCTEQRLREHFSKIHGLDVTDCAIKKTADGLSRCLGFIGYKTCEQAVKARKYFNQTFVDTSRIECEFALSRRKKNAMMMNRETRGGARPWSKYSDGSSKKKEIEMREKKERGKAENGSGSDDEDEDGGRFIGVRERIKLEKQQKKKFVSEEEKMLEERMAKDPKLREFMALMMPNTKFAAKIWSDGLVDHGDGDNKAYDYNQPNASIGKKNNALNDGEEKLIEDTEDGAGLDSDSDDDEYQDLLKSDSDDDSDDSESNEVEEGSDSDDVKKDETVSDMDYLKMKKGNFSDSSGSDGDDSDDSDSDSSDDDDDDDDDVDDEDSEEENSDDSDDEKKKKKKKKKNKDKDNEDEVDDDDDDEKINIKNEKEEPEVINATDMESLQETGRVFLRNLPYITTEEEIFEMLSRIGKVSAVHVLVDKSTRQSKGLAYATFVLPEDGVKCIEEIDGEIFQGRILHILPAKRAPLSAKNTLGGVGRIALNNNDDSDDEDGKNSYKKKKEQMRKADASDKKAWNALFMRQDTVLSAVAAIYGIDKRELLSAETEDVAVRVALGEAQVIANTKKELGDNGVNVKSLESAGESRENVKVKRSTTSILIKNLPYETEEFDLREMCEKFGSLAKLVLPSTRTIAVAEFLEPSEARKAFQGLAYKRYKHVPLYVEWAPFEIFDYVKKSESSDDGDGDGDDDDDDENKKSKQKAANINNNDFIDESEKSKILFVKGIDFATTDENLRSFFENLAKKVRGKVVSAKIAKKPNAGPGGQTLSKGFGFVEFESHETAKKCEKLAKSGGSKLDGKVLAVELSKQKSQSIAETDDDDKNSSKAMKRSSKIPAGKSATKLVLRNVAFEATKRDIQKLFNPFGTLKSVRVPKKFDGSHRGFAFIEFSTQREATDAMEALGNAHLYGRKCVIERAEEDDEDNDNDDGVFASREGALKKLREKAARQIEGKSAKRARMS